MPPATAFANYFERVVPDPYWVLGLALKPFSIGRYRIMKRLGVAFVADGQAKAEISDLLIGVIICSMRCDEFHEMVDRGELLKEVRRWSSKISPHPWIGGIPLIGKWWRRHHSFDLFEKIRLFQRYITESVSTPRYRELSNDCAALQSNAHWSHTVESVLREKQNWTDEDINELPMSKALADYLKYFENQGAIRFLSDDEISEEEIAEANANVYAAAYGLDLSGAPASGPAEGGV